MASSIRPFLTSVALGIASALPFHALAQDTPPHLMPVSVVAPARLTVTSSSGTGQFPLFLSEDWSLRARISVAPCWFFTAFCAMPTFISAIVCRRLPKLVMPAPVR